MSFTKQIKKYLRKFCDKTILLLSHISKTDTLLLAYFDMGIIRSGDFRTSGEMFFAKNILPKMILEKPVIFDVGANTGEYSDFLRKIFPIASIFCFEPNSHTFKELQKKARHSSLEIFPMGLSSKIGKAEIFMHKEFKTSGYTSLHGENFGNILGYTLSEKEEISLTTLDDFCKNHNIRYIDFLKIDTEGHELSVLRGGKDMLTSNKIKIIQFEFNVTNIASRTFLRDFYDIMPNYDFYRIRKSDIISLGEYNPKNEIFRMQNLVAILKNTIHVPFCHQF